MAATGLAACGMPSEPLATDVGIEVREGGGPGLSLVGAHLVDVAARRIRRDQTVRISGGVVASIAPSASDDGDAEGTVVTGRGDVFVVPGFYDSHVHTFAREEFWLYLANGVTTIRNMSGSSADLAWRDSIARGELIGPRLFTSGAILDGDPPSRSTNTVLRTPAEATSEVERQVAAGYDFIKIYDNVPLDVYRALVDATAAADIPLVGHLPTAVGLDSVIAIGGQTEVEHSEELFPFTGAQLRTPGEVGAILAAAGVTLVPTIAVMESAYIQARDGSAVLEADEISYVSEQVREWFRWDATVAERARQAGAAAAFLDRTRTAQAIARETCRAGGRVLVGSDVPIPVLVPGFAFHDELRLLVEAGFDTWDALAAATVEPATYYGGVADPDLLAPGAAADFVLLEGDPSADISATQAILGVVLNGRLLTLDELNARLSEIRGRD